MAFDWLAKNIYVLDAGMKQIIVCSVRLVSCTVLSTIRPIGHLQSVTVDPLQGSVHFNYLIIQFNTPLWALTKPCTLLSFITVFVNDLVKIKNSMTYFN